MRFVLVMSALLLSGCALNPVDVTPSVSLAGGVCTSRTELVTVTGVSCQHGRDLCNGLQDLAQALQDKRKLLVTRLPTAIQDDKVIGSVRTYWSVARRKRPTAFGCSSPEGAP